MNELPIEISRHARQQMEERGADQREVVAAIREGRAEPGRGNRVMYRKNFQFEATWRGQRYRIKQVAPIVAEERDRLVVVTVYTFYF